VQAELEDVRAQALRVNAELERLRADLIRLETREQHLTQALGATESPPTGPPPRRANITEHVLGVVKSAGGQALAPSDVHEFLTKRGVGAQLDTVRQALRRCVDRGELAKADGRYFDPRPQSRSFDYAEAMTRGR
jgi:hypothetical protein